MSFSKSRRARPRGALASHLGARIREGGTPPGSQSDPACGTRQTQMRVPQLFHYPGFVPATTMLSAPNAFVSRFVPSEALFEK